MMWAHGWLNRQARNVMSSRWLSTTSLALPTDPACAATNQWVMDSGSALRERPPGPGLAPCKPNAKPRVGGTKRGTAGAEKSQRAPRLLCQLEWRHRHGQLSRPFRLVRADDDGHENRQALLRQCRGLGRPRRLRARFGL